MEKSSIKNLLSFTDDKAMLELREKTARKVFIFFAFLFFLSYFSIWVSFYGSFFSIIIPKIYFLFIISGTIFLSFLIKNNLKNNFFKIILWGITAILATFSLLAFIVPKEIILNLFK